LVEVARGQGGPRSPGATKDTGHETAPGGTVRSPLHVRTTQVEGVFMTRTHRLPLVPAIAFILLAAPVPALAKVVSEPAMASHCAEAAATELGVMMNDVLTLPVERTSGKYHVYGQYPVSGQNVTLFECQYGGKKHFLSINVQGHHGHAGPAAGSAPRAAQRACSDMMGAPVNIEQVSPLRPGFHEIIMKETNSARRVACTVSDKGSIEDWVEMN
jgi:hypothetical protein